MHAVSELDDARTIIASSNAEDRVLRAGAGKVRNLMPRVSVDLDLELDLVSTSAAQMSLGCETLRVAAEQQVAQECEQLQQRHAGITFGYVRPIAQLGASTMDQVFELWPVDRATIPAHLLKRLLMGAIIGAATASRQGIGMQRGQR